MLKLPAVIVNCKAFAEGTGKNAISLARVCEKASKQSGITVAIAVQPADVYHVRSASRALLFAQHVDPVGPGPHTGAVLAESVKQAGANGTLLNHSEKKLEFEQLKKSLERARKAGLTTIACAATPEEAKKIAKLKPDVIAIEPPELIGGNVSVSTAKPEIITATTNAVRDVPILCGAGIRTKEDVSKAKMLGVQGVLVASGVVLADDREKVLNDFCEGLQ